MAKQDNAAQSVDMTARHSRKASPEQIKPGCLAFFARGETLTHHPGSVRSAAGGTLASYVARERKRLESGAWSFPATESPYFVDEHSQVAARLASKTRTDQALWPADKYTARVCQVSFTPTVFNNGEHAKA